MTLHTAHLQTFIRYTKEIKDVSKTDSLTSHLKFAIFEKMHEFQVKILPLEKIGNEKPVLYFKIFLIQ